jgi:hypothetical protein
MRGGILDKAKEIITGERQDQYGAAEDSFNCIATYWTAYFCNQGWAIQISREDVALLMVLFKLARQHNQHKEDNLIDAVGYLALAAEMWEEDE